MTIAPPEANRFLKLLLFSPSGVGKTYMAGTAQDDPRTSPCLFLDMEGGTETLVGRDIDVAHIKSWDDYNYAFREVQKGHYKSAVVDSLSETQVFALDDILQKEGGNRRDKELLDQRDYGKGLVILRRFVRAWRDLPIHVVMTALANEKIDPREGTIVVPKFAGQFTEDASAMMGVVAYLAMTTDDKTRETRRVLLLKNQSRFRVKARTPYGADVPDSIDNPTITRLLDVLHYPPAESGAAMAKPVIAGKA